MMDRQVKGGSVLSECRVHICMDVKVGRKGTHYWGVGGTEPGSREMLQTKRENFTCHLRMCILPNPTWCMLLF